MGIHVKRIEYSEKWCGNQVMNGNDALADLQLQATKFTTITTVHGSANPRTPGCENVLGKLR